MAALAVEALEALEALGALGAGLARAGQLLWTL